jgi:hypothetical protein
VSDMYGFGPEDTEPQTEQPAPKWFRQHMDKVSEDLKVLREENDRLKAAQQQQAVREALTAKGFAPQVADLYQGTPDKLDDWLGTYGSGLAKTDGAAVEAGQGAQGTPQTVVSPESQAALAAFGAAGSDGASSALTGEEQLAARMNAAQTPEEFAAIMREAGNRRF